ncbi:MAG: DUF4954 family protein [Paludibacter sp.]|nr:DUF4954 family protein [Bacteroidales bacterium]MCM1069413.1 DUF4954 family protein [Prevotella sp.]MCM1353788.1 DUF4954 family protein [Bacteroides sp.]MCM1442811.1 DUF4954 family protein [Muribaculum sp.]MCM1481823.1 DUF4954 family protein [Paludibacter sp.]
MSYRLLSSAEIEQLTRQNCRAENWENISVCDPFDISQCQDTYFTGIVRIGSNDYTFVLEGGIPRHAGIRNAGLHNCTIGNNVYINGIHNYIANYRIDDYAYIENTNRIATIGESSFGVGTEVSVLNETGGREVPLYERLSAQTAYMLAMYRHNLRLAECLSHMVQQHAASIRSKEGRIGKYCRIVNAGEIVNMNIGDYAVIEGVARLENGTIAGSAQDPVYAGAGVIASDFILASGSRVEDGAVLCHVFAGQGTHISHLFSAHDSLFFANCACENGEACAIFAGPYTVSLHKSSLLIAGMFSFLNAGSGSNQSNHMYKLGPIHQGVVERGSKTTSDSYILWPARIGAFSLVMGRHVSHPDTSRLPFSYLIENKGRTYLVPGVNLKSVGTIRDAQKWPKRDKRKDSDRLDLINFNLLSPYTISKMLDGIALLNKLEHTSGLTADQYAYQTMTIDARALRKGREYYRMAVDKFMGNSVIKRLEKTPCNTIDQIRERLRPTHAYGQGEWIDLSGLIVPKEAISRLIDNITNGKIEQLQEIEKYLHQLHADYYDMEWTWVAEHIEDWWGKPCDALTAEDIAGMVDRWQESVVRLDQAVYEDAKKEFSLVSKTGFGMDGSEARQESDFAHVRGAFDKDPFVNMVKQHMQEKTALGEELKARLQHLL